MSTRLLRNITLCGSGVMLCLLAAMLLPMASSAQPSDTSAETAGALAPLAPDDTPAPEPSPEATPAAPPDPGVAIPEAENHLRKGVELYNQNLFLEALSEFNRALALDPTMENAKLFQEKCNGKLQMGAIGGDPAAIPTFETLDPASIAESAETPQLSAGEMKIQRVRELLKLADLYLENERYSTAGSIYEEIMLIAPDNTRARAGLHKATIGASKQDMKEAEAEVAEDRWKTKRYIERSKGLPEGADATGIKQYRISVPKIDEEYMPPRDKTEIEKTLDSPVSLIFEDIHLREIVDFISESYDTNVVVDDRVVMPPAPPAPAATGRPAAALPGAPGAYPMMPGATGGRGMPGAARPYPGSPAATNMPAAYRPQQQAGFGTQGANQGGGMLQGEYVTDGIIRYVYIKNVTLREGLKALLRPLKLDFSVQPSFIWISTPDNLRHESFEELETRYYELRNAGAETLFKIVLRNPGGSSGGGGGYGGGGGGYGGGRGGGGYGGGGIGGGGYGGGGIGGGGYGGGGIGGGGYGGGGYGGGGIGLGGGGYGGGGGGYGGGRGGGGYGGGGIGGGGGGVTIQNISQLFGSINDSMVGETPAIVGTSGISGATTTPGGVTTGVGAGGYGAGTQGAYGAGTQAAGLGGTRGRAMNVAGDEPEIVRLLRLLIDDVYEPSGTEPISRMVYVPLINKLMVHNTPTNLAKLEKQLVELDVTPKQVSIEAKFITVKTNDLKKTGFKWDISRSDQNSRDQAIPGLEETTYLYDINGDGILESIPFYTRPGGSNVITNTITSALMSSVTSPGPDSSFSISGIITDNEDGDRLSMVFDYLDSLDETELLSAPRVTTMNRKPAVIVDLTTEWYTSMVDSQIVTSGGGFAGGSSIGSITREQPSQFNYGITLSVTPQISGGDQVRLWLNPQVTTRGGDSEFITRTNINGEESELKYKLPNTFTQAVWTNVIVHDGDTLVLGGLVDDRTSRGSEKTPYLADIPVLGFFFKGKSRETRQSSLLIFVTPTIIDTTGSRFFEVGGSSFQPYGVMPKEDKAPEMAPDTFSVDPSAWAPEPSPVEEVPAESVAETEDAI